MKNMKKDLGWFSDSSYEDKFCNITIQCFYHPIGALTDLFIVHWLIKFKILVVNVAPVNGNALEVISSTYFKEKL